jgi:outer membrane protein insertion porin family
MMIKFLGKILLILLLVSFDLCLAQTKRPNINGFELDDIRITFDGKQSFSEDDIKNILVISQRDVFDMEEYITDVQRIEKFYFDIGFFDAKVDTGLLINYSDKEVVARYIITENSRYSYKNIQYLGLTHLNEELKDKLLDPEYMRIKDGEYYDKIFIIEEFNRILDTLLNSGYALASGKPPEVLKYETDDPDLLNKVEVRFIFEPKELYRIGNTSVQIKGNRYNVTDEDLLRELEYKEGDIYNKSQLIKSELALSRISILDNPRITIDGFDSVNHIIDLTVEATIENKYELTPELVAYEIENKLYGGTGLSYTDKYFFGGGRVFNSRIRFLLHSIHDYRMEFLTQVYQPFLFGKKDISGNWAVGAEYYTNDQFNRATMSNTFTVNIDFPKYTYVNKLTGEWKISNFRINNKKEVYDPTQPDSILRKFTFNIFISTLSGTIIHNRVNNIQFPYKGIYQVYSVEESGLLGNIIKKIFNTSTFSYVKFTSFNTAYFNLSDSDILEKVNSALATKLLTGILVEYGDNKFFFIDQEVTDDVVPLDAKFVAGGSSSVRGWAGKQLGIVPDKKVGGNFIIEGSAEHRLRPFLEKTNFFKDLGFATFFDFGNVWTNINKFKLNEVALAIGGGIRYYTIVGAVRLDIGFKLYDPQPGDVGGSKWLFGSGANFSDKYTIQIGLGNTF